VPTVGALADRVGGQVRGDRSLEIRGLAPLETAGPDEISFLAHPRYRPLLARSRAGAVIAPPGTELAGPVLVEHEAPYLAFAALMRHLHPDPEVVPGAHPAAAVDPTAQVAPSAGISAGAVIQADAVVGERVFVGPGAVVGEGVVLEERTRVEAGAVLVAGTRCGARCRIGPGAVVGSAGFGYAPTADGWEAIPQVGVVVLEDDVEIGANTTVDRATLGTTRLGRGVKLDNLVHVGHNVTLGKGTVIVAQSGVSGSTEVGEGVQIGGQVGLVGHLRIGDGARIGAGSGVRKDIPAGETQSGAPAFDHARWRRSVTAFPQLPDLLKRVRALEREVARLRGDDDE
jgi:UDP-3-O-[3-hydroxymyristoyl] glucosamine N-acyltransferase